MRTKGGGGKKSKNFVDIINGSPLIATRKSLWRRLSLFLFPPVEGVGLAEVNGVLAAAFGRVLVGGRRAQSLWARRFGGHP